MKQFLPLAAVAIFLLGGCQSLGEHFRCLNEVDGVVPAQTQQKLIRTDTLCKPTFPERGTACTHTPVYETIVLNQPQRDAAYQQCRNRVTTNANAAAPAVPPQRGQKLSPNTPFCKHLAKSDGINGAVYRSQCN
jgi:hypothetical protein